jgi:excisionase family DNA binding protein
MSSVFQEVLTLDEVAKYLRLPKKTIEQQAIHGKIPGRRIEKSWRFLKKGIDRWLQSHDSRDVLLYQAGSLAEDDTLTELRALIYTERGRPETDTTEEP